MRPTKWFWLDWLLAVAIGTWLRVHDLGDQIPISDEWHGLQVAAQQSARQLATLMTAGATSIPYNLYLHWLLEGPGWSEWTVRMPSLVAGVASVALAPLLLWRVIGERAAGLCGALLAVSPLLILYSRYARPYAPVVLLSLVALLACHRWIATGSARAALALACAGVLAAWLHVLELRLLGLCLGFAVAAKILGRRIPALAIAPGWRSVALVALGSGAALAALLLPAALATGERLFQVLGADPPNGGTLLAALALLGGSSARLGLFVLAPLAALGSFQLARRDLRLAALCAVVTLGCVASIFAAHPDDSDVAQVFARYAIPLLPIGAIVLALGIDASIAAALARAPAREPTARAGLGAAARWIAVAALLWAGPWPQLYAAPSAFTNHKVFHASYDPAPSEVARYRRYLDAMHWRAGRVDVVEPAFYRTLAAQPGDAALIEYPVPVGDIFSFHFLRQQRDGRRTIGGWLPANAAAQTRLGHGRAMLLADDVLSALPDPDRIHFASLVRIDDPEAVRASGARHLVVHRNLAAEMRGPRVADAKPFPLLDVLTAHYGEPVYEDAWISVYELGAQ